MHCSKEFVWRPCEGVIIQLSAGKFKLKSLFSFSNSLSSLIISELNERFADASILSNFRIFDPRSYVGITTAQELNDFGKVSFEVLLKHFCAKKAPQKLFEIPDPRTYSAVMAEFLTFKKIMWALVKKAKKILVFELHGPTSKVIMVRNYLASS